MRKKDILELKKRLKKDHCTFTKVCGCYVNGEKNIILNFNETFLNLEEDEFFKYLEIAKKTLSGTIGNNILELDFSLEEENISDKQQFLLKLRNSKLKDELVLNDFYKTVIDSYNYEGNFLILLFHDAYDVITKTSDNLKLDESEEVYEYILCAVCPVSLSKAGLGYFEEDNKIGAINRDWVVETPSLGFVYPAFIDRSSDVNSVMYYTKNAKDPHPEVMNYVLGCNSKQTATEQKEAFTYLVQNAVGADEKEAEHVFMEIQETINNMIDEHNIVNDNNADSIVLTKEVVQDILSESEIPEEIAAKIQESYTENFDDAPPLAEHLIDTKALEANAQRKKEERLEKQVETLQNELEKVRQDTSLNLDSEVALESDIPSSDDNTLNADSTTNLDHNNDFLNYDIVLQVKPEKVPEIKTQIIDGKKYIVIPVEDDEQTNINGVDNLI